MGTRADGSDAAITGAILALRAGGVAPNMVVDGVPLSVVVWGDAGHAMFNLQEFILIPQIVANGIL